MLSRNTRLSLGAKHVNVKTHYMESFFTKRDGRDDAFVEEYSQHDDFTYTEQRAAAYAIFEFKGKDSKEMPVSEKNTHGQMLTLKFRTRTRGTMMTSGCTPWCRSGTKQARTTYGAYIIECA